jgi:glutathionylspermidine synthase
MTTAYMRDTAEQAGILTASIDIEDIGWDHERRQFVDLSGRPITDVFKLYPWEWLLGEEFGKCLIESHGQMQWIEPIWKLLLSNKGLLPILWELYPGHPNLLETHLGEPRDMTSYVRKPIFSREGGNILICSGGCTLQETDGDYGAEGFIFQQLAPLPCFDGNYPILGSWVIDQESAGIGIRETRTLITDNASRFVPHLFLHA